MRIDLKFETDDIRIEMHWTQGRGGTYSTYVKVLNMQTGKRVIMTWPQFLKGIIGLSGHLIDKGGAE